MDDIKKSEFLTLSKTGLSEYTEKKSVFIAVANPVKTESEALDLISAQKKKYHDAKHNVYAYIIQENNITRFSDDGEPQGTAGLPILNVLKSKNITNAVVVVTRYFGGTLLGTGGLTRAYGTSAKDAIENAGLSIYKSYHCFDLTIEYDEYSKLIHELKKCNVTEQNKTFTDKVTINLCVLSDNYHNAVNCINSVCNGKYAPQNLTVELLPEIK